MQTKSPRSAIASSVFAFAVRVNGAPQWGETIYNTTTAGRAKNAHYVSVSEAWPDLKFTDMRVRKVGAPHTSAEFRRTAAYRSMPNLNCGQRIEVAVGQGRIAQGTIVGHNSSANFDVLFDEGGPYAGLTLNVHPQELTLLASASA
jgi:hypothetical protein